MVKLFKFEVVVVSEQVTFRWLHSSSVLLAYRGTDAASHSKDECQ